MKQELITSKIVELEERKIKRECKGRSLALTRNVFRIEHLIYKPRLISGYDN